MVKIIYIISGIIDMKIVPYNTFQNKDEYRNIIRKTMKLFVHILYYPYKCNDGIRYKIFNN